MRPRKSGTSTSTRLTELDARIDQLASEERRMDERFE